MPLLKNIASQKWASQEPAYQQVNQAASDGFEPPLEQYTMKRSSRWGAVLRGAAIGIAAILLLLAVSWWPARLVSSTVSQHLAAPKHHEGKDELSSVHTCGDSIEEAQLRGCTWDLLAGSWLPQRCIDQELSDEFRTAGDWHYYANKDGTGELTEHELQFRVGPNATYFTTLEYHRTHCAYQWRKMHRAMQSGGRIENALADYHHTLHCGKIFLQEGELSDLLTAISVEFYYC